jgi:hypothetical protein
MDVICFLCVSLGSTTVQLHDRLDTRRACECSKAGFSSQNGNHARGMYYRRAEFCCPFLWGKGLTAKDINTEVFLVYGGKCLSRKAVHNRVTNVSVMKKWLRQQSKCFYGAVFDALVKRWDKYINVGGGYVEKYFFQVRMSDVLRFISICDLFTDSSSCEHSSLRNKVP